MQNTQKTRISGTHVYQPISFFSGASDIDPPIPPDTDLRNIRWFKLDMIALLNSDFMQLASPEEFKAAFLLWCKSIHQIPAGSLPNDEAILAKLAGGYDHRRKPWKHIRDMALHGWSLCSDNRLHHQANKHVTGTVLKTLASKLHKFRNLWHSFEAGGAPCKYTTSVTGSGGFIE